MSPRHHLFLFTDFATVIKLLLESATHAPTEDTLAGANAWIAANRPLVTDSERNE